MILHQCVGFDKVQKHTLQEMPRKGYDPLQCRFQDQCEPMRVAIPEREYMGWGTISNSIKDQLLVGDRRKVTPVPRIVMMVLWG